MKHKKELSLSIACFLLSFLCFMAWNQERDENLAAKSARQCSGFT